MRGSQSDTELEPLTRKALQEQLFTTEIFEQEIFTVVGSSVLRCDFDSTYERGLMIQLSPLEM